MAVGTPTRVNLWRECSWEGLVGHDFLRGPTGEFTSVPCLTRDARSHVCACSFRPSGSWLRKLAAAKGRAKNHARPSLSGFSRVPVGVGSAYVDTANPTPGTRNCACCGTRLCCLWGTGALRCRYVPLRQPAKGAGFAHIVRVPPKAAQLRHANTEARSSNDVRITITTPAQIQTETLPTPFAG